jgi:hypothetical protein
MRIFGRYNGYLDEQFRMAIPVTPNAKYQMRALQNWIESHGTYMQVDITYGAATATFHANIQTSGLEEAMNRL